ncbi:MAG: YdcF family protein [Deltaproteobacteria bacterium]|nr:YdcF family protein [Deltaproteobacteria bacterium]
MKKLYLLLGLIVIVVVVKGYWFWSFCQSFYEEAPPEIPQAESIVALTGGKGRLSQALKLLPSSNARLLFISGVGPQVDLQSIFSEEELSGVDASKIYLDPKSTSTYQNALEARHYLIQQGVLSVILVTSNYHMKRSFFIFREVFPPNMNIIPYPIHSDNFNPEEWWRHPPTVKIALTEFVKYGWYQLFFFFKRE